MHGYLSLGLVASLAFGCGTSNAESDDAGLAVDASVTDTSPYDVLFTSSNGAFTLRVHPSWAPHGEARFRELVEAEFYDDCRFFRVVPGFVVQFGINGTPSENAQYAGDPIIDDPVVQSNTRGRVTFAKTSSPNSRTTQIFINYGDNSSLDAMGFAPFAEVIDGMDVVDAINAEYGQMPNQGNIASEGNAYLSDNFPNLDYVETARPIE